MRTFRPLVIAAVALAATICGCASSQNAQDKQILRQQQSQLDKMKSQLAAMQAQQVSTSYNSAPPSGGCDEAVMKDATRKGGEHFAASDYGHALGYYQDAATACPASAQAQLNLARTYEAIGDRQRALQHYRLAATDASGTNTVVAAQANQAIARLSAR
ncbi:MAG: hypothetical protein ACREQ4_16590 [Candidatus Binataceae bacterium]